ncbi:hypothetical protein PR202_gb13215 [Eleusine coracana subsp. coracana]|uniref:Rx N-terminal domain-containing protein n=1 Tax=Eleusine coracana subsp. coracana TaxID=191504 RepID=A0AAV5EPR7_ELECO|nr:hypothetical protein PR202_gb13215 [Eleusine coracana subsp. coracana]
MKNLTERQLWAREVRELSYDLEDAIDRFMVHIDGKPSMHTFKGFIERSINLMTEIKIRHQLGTETKKSKDASWKLVSDIIAPSWLASIYSLSELNISLQTLGEVDIQVLGDIPSLRLLGIYVDKSTHGRDRKLVIEKNKFRCLKRLDVYSPSLDIVFAPGALEKLEDLSLWFGLDETMVQFGGMEFGIENLSSLLEVHIKFWTWNSSMPDFVRAAEDTIRGAISMNPNEPQLNLQVSSGSNKPLVLWFSIPTA